MTANPYTQPTLTAGMLVGNSHLQLMVDGINWGQGTPQSGKTRRPLFNLSQTVAQSIATAGASDTAILFDSETYDTENGHSTSTNTGRFTCQTTGLYWLAGMVAYVSNSSGARKAAFRVNGTSGTTYWAMQLPASSIQTSIGCQGPVFLSAGDYVELVGFQNSGSSVNTDVSAGSGGSRLAGFMLSA